MIHAMLDESVRVASRFPNGHRAMYCHLDRLGGVHGFVLEQDQYRSEIFMLRMVGGYSDCAAHYGDPAEAEADFADLTAMFGDRHHLPPPNSLSTPFGSVKRKRWGWKGAVAGPATNALVAHCFNALRAGYAARLRR